MCKLTEYPGNMPVIKSCDSAGNRYRHIHDVEYSLSDDLEEYEPTVHYEDDILSGDATWDDEPGILDDYTKVLVIW